MGNYLQVEGWGSDYADIIHVERQGGVLYMEGGLSTEALSIGPLQLRVM